MAIFCLLLFTSLLNAQNFSGKVTDCAGNPVPGAVIRIVFPSVYNATVTTDINGNWDYTIFSSDPSGTYQFRCLTSPYGGTPLSRIISPQGGYYLYQKKSEGSYIQSSYNFTITTPFEPKFKIGKIDASPTTPVILTRCNVD